jgi:hypothetical protein
MPPLSAILTYVLAAVALALLAWLVAHEATTRVLIERVRRELELGATAPAEPDADSRLLLAFSVAYDARTLLALGPVPPAVPDVGLCACGGDGKDGVQALAGEYRRAAWLPLRPEASSHALMNAVVSGRVRYLAVAGAVVRVMHLPPDRKHRPGQQKDALLLLDLSSFSPPAGCSAVVPVAALPGTASSATAWSDLVSALDGGSTTHALHIFAF